MAETAPAPVATVAPRQPSVAADAVQDAINNAGFPPGIDTQALFQPAQLSTDLPSVAHMLIHDGLKAYDKLGKSVTEAIENVNLASGRKMTLTSINGEFLYVNTDALKAAMADETQRRAIIEAFAKLNAALAEPAAAARALLPPPRAKPTDTVQSPPPSVAPTPNQSATLSPPAARGATTPPLPVRELPADSPALAGVSERWKKWFAQGNHAPGTLAVMLHADNKKAAAIAQDLPAALDEVARQYNIGQPDGPPNLEAAIASMQEAMQPAGYNGRPEGQWGAETERVRRELLRLKSSDPASLDAITNAVLRTVLRLGAPTATAAPAGPQPPPAATLPQPAAAAPPPPAATLSPPAAALSPPTPVPPPAPEPPPAAPLASPPPGGVINSRNMTIEPFRPNQP